MRIKVKFFSSFGNLVGDMFGGMLGPGSIPGMLGNFLLAYVPYRMWLAFRGDRPADGSAPQLGWTVLCAVAGGIACAVIIGTGVAAMGLVPYGALATAITLNNGIIGTIIAALLLPLLYPRAYKWGLVYTDILDRRDYRRGLTSRAGAVLTWIGCIAGALVAFAFFIMGLLGPGSPLLARLSTSMTPVPAGALCSLLIIIGVVLMSPFGGATSAADDADGAEGGK